MRTFIILFIALAAAATGGVFWKKALAQIGGLSITSLQFFPDIGRLFSNYFFWLAFPFALIVVFSLFDILSHEDFSYAMPLFSLSYVLALLVAKIFLHEEVSVWRWVGVVVIILGVFIIVRTK